MPVHGHTASTVLARGDLSVCFGFCMQSIQLPWVNGLLINVQKNAQRSFLCSHYENFFYSFSVGTLRALGLDNSSLCVEVPRVSGCWHLQPNGCSQGEAGGN